VTQAASGVARLQRFSLPWPFAHCRVHGGQVCCECPLRPGAIVGKNQDCRGHDEALTGHTGTAPITRN